MVRGYLAASEMLTFIWSYLLDLVFGDPRWIPHPVAGVGKAIEYFEKLLRKHFRYEKVGGIVLALTYKAINTLDSMVGYKNKRYVDFGWASAKLDDVANFLPARLTGLLIPKLKRDQIVFVCNPNNPTWQLTPKPELLKLVREAERRKEI